MFDIVIPLGPNDTNIIEKQIEYTKKNIVNYRNIYIVSYNQDIVIEGCIIVDESVFVFKDIVFDKIGVNRGGWYFQQLIKLYAGFILPDILDTYLVIDSDTFFLRPTTFLKNEKCLYNYGSQFHEPYFTHMKKMNENFEKMNVKSGICHHMMFQKTYLNEMIAMVEKKHNDKFYNVFISNVEDINGSGASEYEMYFNYMLKYHDDKIIIRPLAFKDVKKLDFNRNYSLDYICYHYYKR